MKGMSLPQSLGILHQGIRNYVTHKPLVVSFEVTHSCTCNCLHCNRGGKKEEKNLLEPAGYTALISLLRPSVVQVSGGEPLLRENVLDIIKSIKKQLNGLPYVILVTNGSLLNKEKYIELKKAGVNRFSVSLDFPNKKHDEFRRHVGLYAHLEEIIPRLAAEFGYDDIALNSAITRMNLPYLIDLEKKSREWGVSISYSAYGVLRTGDKSLFISSKADLETLRQRIHLLLQLKRQKRGILNSAYTLLRTYEFFKNGYIPNCNAGKRFLVVRPDGYLIPCSMCHHHQLYSTQQEILEKFSKHNKCGECYVAIRSYSDKPLGTLVKDNLSIFFSSLQINL